MGHEAPAAIGYIEVLLAKTLRQDMRPLSLSGPHLALMHHRPVLCILALYAVDRPTCCRSMTVFRVRQAGTEQAYLTQ